MVTGISANNAMPAMMPQQQSQQSIKLTDDQSQLIMDTLAEFDVDNLSATDAQTIVETFSNAGIQPGAALEEAMSDAGFDARSVGELAGLSGGNPPPPPPGGANMSQSLSLEEDVLSDLNELLNDYYSGELSDEEKATTLSSIQSLIQSSAPEDGLLHVTA